MTRPAYRDATPELSGIEVRARWCETRHKWAVERIPEGHGKWYVCCYCNLLDLVGGSFKIMRSGRAYVYGTVKSFHRPYVNCQVLVRGGKFIDETGCRISTAHMIYLSNGRIWVYK